MDKPTHEVEFETMLLSRHIDLRRRPRDHGSGLERSAYVVLSRIGVQGPMSIGQLSDAFGLDTSTLNRQTAALLGAELVERIPDPDGGMARKFRITDEGIRRLRKERAVNIKGLERVLAAWPPREVAEFARLLRQFNTDIERLDGRPWPRPDA